MNPVMKALIKAATYAPSGDNLQPWIFHVDQEQRSIQISVDQHRDDSVLNSGQRMSRIAVGAAMETLIQVAQCNRLEIDRVDMTDDAMDIRFGASAVDSIDIPAEVSRRVTNRRLYTPLHDDEGLLKDLVSAVGSENRVETGWTFGREKSRQISRIVGRADSIMFGNAHLRRAILDNVRVDLNGATEVSKGLSLASLEMTSAQAMAFRAVRRAPDWLSALLPIGKAIGGHTRRLVKSASGICVGFVREFSATADFAIGRMMQRCWLEMTRRGLAVQPMMSLVVLENALLHQDTARVLDLRCEDIVALKRQLRQSVSIGEERPYLGFILRFGNAPAPSGRTGRMDVSECLVSKPS